MGAEFEGNGPSPAGSSEGRLCMSRRGRRVSGISRSRLPRGYTAGHRLALWAGLRRRCRLRGLFVKFRIYQRWSGAPPAKMPSPLTNTENVLNARKFYPVEVASLHVNIWSFRKSQRGSLVSRFRSSVTPARSKGSRKTGPYFGSRAPAGPHGPPRVSAVSHGDPQKE